MKKIDECVGKYSVSKTLRFRAIPVGKTLENIQEKQLIQEDEYRASQFKDVKKLMDRYHAAFVERVLANVTLSASFALRAKINKLSNSLDVSIDTIPFTSTVPSTIIFLASSTEYLVPHDWQMNTPPSLIRLVLPHISHVNAFILYYFYWLHNLSVKQKLFRYLIQL